MSEKSRNSWLQSIPWPAVAMVVGSLGIFAPRAILETMRPEGDDVRPPNSAEQSVRSRLWEDPLAGPYAAHAEGRKAGTDARATAALAALRRELTPSEKELEKKGNKPGETVLILPVFVGGGPYPEDQEGRLRTRYAIQTALSAAGYAPDDPQHIGYFEWRNPGFRRAAAKEAPPSAQAKPSSADRKAPLEPRTGAARDVADVVERPAASTEDSDDYGYLQMVRPWREAPLPQPAVAPSSAPTPAPASKPTAPDPDDDPSADLAEAVVVPFEWFTLTTGAEDVAASSIVKKQRRVLVQWIDEVFVRRWPVTTVAAIQNSLLGDFATRKDDRLPKVRLSVIGPTSSATLISMVGDALTGDSRRRFGIPEGRFATVYCASATVPDEEIAAAYGRTVKQKETDLKDSGLAIERVIESDETPAKMLLDELELRRALPNDRRRLLIVGEWDSAYGRAFSATFKRDLAKRYADARPPLDPNELVLLIPYLRGVDGRVGGAKGSTALAGAAHGRSQSDYLRRLEVTLRETDERLGAAGKMVSAVGVLGSDVYDKLVILRALRGALPKAVYFTTDLDARLWTGAEAEFTRNLVVASQFGLSPHDGVEAADRKRTTLAPFRDQYQTATYLAATAALEGRETDKGEGKGRSGDTAAAPEGKDVVADGPKQGRIFELGRTSATELRTEATPTAIAMKASILPYGSAALAAAVFLAFFLSRDFRRVVKALLGGLFRRRSAAATGLGSGGMSLDRLVMGIWALVAVAIIALASFDSSRIGGEPFSFTAGVSCWPAALIAMTAAWLSWVFLRRGSRSFAKNFAACELEFGLMQAGEPPSPAASPAPAPEPLHSAKTRAEAVIGTGDTGIDSILKRPWLEATAAFEALPASSRTVGGLWGAYLEVCAPSRRTIRIFCITVAYLIASLCVIGSLGWNTEPARGELARVVYIISQAAGIGMFVLLVAFVFDATGQCARFIAELAPDGPAENWPRFPSPFVCAVEPGREPPRSPEVDAFVRDAELRATLIERHTASVCNMTYAPFSLLLVLVAARTRVFENWEWAAAMVACAGVHLLSLWICGVRIRASASRMRKRITDTLKEKIRALDACMPRVSAAKDDLRKLEVDAMSAAIKRIDDNNGGAFRPWHQDPVFGAILIPFGGTGALGLMEMFLR